MVRTVWRERLRIPFIPYLVLSFALLLAPAVGYLAAWMERIEDAKHPPPCYADFGPGCDEFFPAGPTTAILYVMFVIVVSIVIALLHLIGWIFDQVFDHERLVVLRSCIAIGAVVFVWGLLAIGVVATVLA
jgi:hypothetical protein